MTTMPPRMRFGAFALLAGTLLIGFAQILLLPPWEGFAETAHYSYVQQLSETGYWPRFGEPMAKDVEDYLKLAPTARSMHGPWTYSQFFASGPDTIEAGRRIIQA